MRIYQFPSELGELANCPKGTVYGVCWADGITIEVAFIGVIGMAYTLEAALWIGGLIESGKIPSEVLEALPGIRKVGYL